MAERESVYLWSTTAASNDDADPSINFLEGQLPSTLNNSNRGVMAAHARWIKDIDGSLTTGGSSNAYTLTINGTQTAYATGHMVAFKASFTNTAAATLNVTNADATALGAKAIRGSGDTALAGGEIISGGLYLLQYSATANSAAGAFLLVSQSIPFTQPVSYPVAVMSGHLVPYLDGDAQFGNIYSQYPFGVVSGNPISIGKAGSSCGAATLGTESFQVRFTSTGLSGSPITITYAPGAIKTADQVATAFCAAVNANTTLHGTGGKPIFAQPTLNGAGGFNLQYDAAYTATGATPLTTTSIGTGTVTLALETNALDSIIQQLGRDAATRSGSVLYALDFTGRDASSSSLNIHYGVMSVTATVATAGATRATFNFFTAANNGGYFGRVGIKEGLFLYDSLGANGTDVGPGIINLPTTGYYNVGASSLQDSGLFSANHIGGTAPGSTVNVQGTNNVTPSGADFVQLKASAVNVLGNTGVSILNVGNSGTIAGRIVIAGSSSGAQTWQPAAAAGTGTLTFPAGTATVATTAGASIPTVATGDILYGSGANALSALADIATGNALISGGVSTAPSWGKIGLTTHISGTLAAGNGGTGITSLGTGVATALGVNIDTNGAMLVRAGALGTPSSGTLSSCSALPSGTGITGTFTNTTPTPSSTGGAFTTASSSIDAVPLGANASLICVVITITTVGGSASGNITVTLPVTPAKSGALVGQCLNNGKTVTGAFTSGSSTMTVTNYDATTPIAAAIYVLQGIVKF